MLISLHATVCVQCVCLVCMLCWMWMARPSLVITYIPGVRGQTKPWDDTADPTISLSPAVNSNLARHRACIPLLWASINNTVTYIEWDNLQRCSSKNQGTICCFDSPLIQCSSKAVFLIWKPVKTSSSIHMCLTAEARLHGYAEHVHMVHERDCG